MTRLFRRTTLHLGHIFFTDAFTFIFSCLELNREVKLLRPFNYFALTTVLVYFIGYFVANQDPDPVQPHFPGKKAQHFGLVIVVFHLEKRIGKSFNHHPFFYLFIFIICHIKVTWTTIAKNMPDSQPRNGFLLLKSYFFPNFYFVRIVREISGPNRAEQNLHTNYGILVSGN